MAKSIPTPFGPLQLLTVDELAKRFDLTPRTIRSYQEHRVISEPHHFGRHAFYGPEHARELARVRAAMASGRTLREIAAGLHRRQEPTGKAPKLVDDGKERLVKIVPVVPGISLQIDADLDPSQRQTLKILMAAVREAQARHRSLAKPTARKRGSASNG